jgi:hypothetical protein
MKKVFILAFLMAGLTGFSQVPGDHPRHRMMGKDFSPEQRATLKSKQLALALDLNEQQQSQVMALQLKRAEERKALMDEHQKNADNERPASTPEERFNRINTYLDRQLAFKSEMKKILSKAQYEKWNRMMVHKQNSHREGRGHRSNHSRR